MDPMIQISWYDEKEAVLYWQISGRTSLNEFEFSVQKSYRMVSAKPYIVDVIIDLDDLAGLSFNILRMTWVASTKRASNTGVAVVLGQTSIWKHLWETMITMFGRTSHTVRFAQTMTQAETIIHEAQHARTRV